MNKPFRTVKDEMAFLCIIVSNKSNDAKQPIAYY